MKNLQKDLEKELENKRKSEEKIKLLQSQISQEKQSKKLPKNIEKAFEEAMALAQDEMRSLIEDIAEKEHALWEIKNLAEIKAVNVAEKYGVPVRYSVSGTDYIYGPKSYEDKWSEYEDLLKDNCDFYPAFIGWSSSNC